ncbi:MAG: oligoendopeptidase F, partial [Chlamydiales bacterium]|nr:oligoendopeptidase F [Chlamydiales bacterium]
MSLETKQMEKTPAREEIRLEDRWNVERLYPSWEAWEKEMKLWGREEKNPKWPEIASFRGKLAQGAPLLKDLIEQQLLIDRGIGKLYTYAHLRHDEDVGSDVAKGAYVRVLAVYYAFREESAWVEPELLSMPEESLQEMIRDPLLESYRLHLEKIVRQKKHILKAEQEELLAACGNALETANKAFGALNNADLKFEPVIDSEGMQRELTHGKYRLHLQDKDPKVREGAFKNLHTAFLSHENTLCELLNGQIQKQSLEAKVRKFPSCLESALFPNQIDISVYKSLVEAVKKHLPSLHRYILLRKKVMGLEELHLYDLYLPLIDGVDMKMSYEAASCEIIE